MPDSPAKRRWFQFSLRTLFVVVTVVGSVAGWTVYQVNWIRQRHQFLADQKTVMHNLGFPTGGPGVDLGGSAPGMLSLLGEPGVKRLALVLVGYDSRPESYLEWKLAQKLFPEAKLAGIPKTEQDYLQLSRVIQNHESAAREEDLRRRSRP